MAESQKIENIALKDLVLWTENPRDPIDPNASDQSIANRAIETDSRKKWSIKELFKSMGGHYDTSEIPTVVWKNKKPVVYDGNRRVLIGKIIHGYVDGFDIDEFQSFDFPEVLPCNVCEEKIALENILRKHGNSGSWRPLERDIFLHKHMGEEKSIFLKVEEHTGLISNHVEMNKRFVKEEVLTKENLNKLGFFETKSGLKTVHTKAVAGKIFTALAEKIIAGVVTTRIERGNIIGVLKQDPKIAQRVKQDWSQSKKPKVAFSQKITPTAPAKHFKLFGNTVTLKQGTVNNLYKDIRKLGQKKSQFTGDFVIIIRMALRLLCETAAKEVFSTKTRGNGKVEKYVNRFFDDARKKLTQDERLFLNLQSVTKAKMVKLLHTSAHANRANLSYDQTIAMSLIIARMLKLSHPG